MISKKALVNTLFLVGFTVFGFGNYISLKQGLSKGMIVSVSPFLVIIAFFLVDSVYRERLRHMLTGTYWLSMLYIGTLMASMFVALRGGIPGVNTGNALLSCLMFAAPFNAAVIVQYYNRDDDDFDFARMLMIALGLLMFINIAAYAGGVRAYGHGFEGRANLPFIRGLYTGAHVLSILSLMMIFHLKDPGHRPLRFALILGALMVSLVVMLGINSRLSLMIFLLLTLMFLTRALKVVRGIYTISLFTMPLLLSFSLLVYRILSLPFFAAILQRVSKEDVVTFNGRSYIWNAVADWTWNDRTGFLFGNGYLGHYKLHLLDEVARMWGTPHAYNMHTHSTFTEVLLAQGVLGVGLLYVLLWRAFKFYRGQYLLRSRISPIFGGLVYILFIWQIDIFCYGVDIGHSILFTMLAPLAIDPKYITRKEKDLDGAWLE